MWRSPWIGMARPGRNLPPLRSARWSVVMATSSELVGSPDEFGPSTRHRVSSAVATPLLALSIGAMPTPAATTVVGALGLTVLAATDARSRHLSRHVVRVFAAAVVVAVAIEAWHGTGWDVVAKAGAGAVLCAALVGGLWWTRPGSVAFGDVKVLTITAAAAAVLSWRAAAITMAVACWTGAAWALAPGRRLRVHPLPAAGPTTIPFIPPLLVGFLAGALWA